MRVLQSISLFLLAAISSSASEDCIYSVSLNKESYLPGEDIKVSLQQCEPDLQDFVAIYDADVDLKDIDGDIKGDVKYRMWMRACGSPRCSQPKESAVFAFGQKNNKHTWPLPIGTYKAYLVKKDEKNGFASYFPSRTFKVERKDPKLVKKISINLG
jgi:hypothetical protein